jgi:hypothetical protein
MANMEERYAVVLNGKRIGTVHLDPEHRGTVRARLAPLPAFRAVARHRRTLATAQEWELREEDLTPAELAALDGAEAVLDSLKLTLTTDPSGSSVATQRIRLLRGDPPFVQVTW